MCEKHHDTDTRVMALFGPRRFARLRFVIVRVDFTGHLHLEVLRGSEPPADGFSFADTRWLLVDRGHLTVLHPESPEAAARVEEEYLARRG